MIQNKYTLLEALRVLNISAGRLLKFEEAGAIVSQFINGRVYFDKNEIINLKYMKQ